MNLFLAFLFCFVFLLYLIANNFFAHLFLSEKQKSWCKNSLRVKNNKSDWMPNLFSNWRDISQCFCLFSLKFLRSPDFANQNIWHIWPFFVDLLSLSRLKTPFSQNELASRISQCSSFTRMFRKVLRSVFGGLEENKIKPCTLYIMKEHTSDKNALDQWRFIL